MNDEAKGLVMLVAFHTGVPYDDIMGECKRRPIVRARDIAILAVRRRFGMTYPALSEVFSRPRESIKNAALRAIKSKDAQDTIREILEYLQCN